MKENLNRIVHLGNVSNDGKPHQSGCVVDRGGYYQHNTQNNTRERLRRSEDGELIIMGTIGNTDRQNRDNGRVFSQRSVCPCLKANISKEATKVIRRWIR